MGGGAVAGGGVEVVLVVLEDRIRSHQPEEFPDSFCGLGLHGWDEVKL